MTAAAAAGFRRVGLTLWAPGTAPAPLCAGPAAGRALREHLTSAGVTVCDVGVVVLSPALEPEQLRRVVDTAALLGADRLLVMNQEPDPADAAGRLRTVCEVAGGAGISVAVEFMPYTATRTLRDALDLVGAGAGAGVVVDLLHLDRSGGTAADLARVDPALVHLVQLCDARRPAPPPERLRAEALGDRLYPGEGDLPLPDLLAALPPGVAMTVEAPVARDAHRSPLDRARAAADAVTALLG